MPEPTEPNTPFVPDWQEITADPNWNAQIKPYIEAVLQHKYAEMVAMADKDTFQFYQGQCQALRDLLAEPEKQVAMEMMRVRGMAQAGFSLEQIHPEETDNARGRGNWGARLQRFGRRGTGSGAGGNRTGS